jgi:hypothetical protein
LAARLSPLGHWNSVPPKATQEALRLLFQQWGLPDRARFDNGHPWGSSTDLPPALALWLIGLGVGLVYNPPRSPKHNCFVERLQGLAEPWAEPERCASVEEYQASLAWAIRVQREEYPAIARPSARPTENQDANERGKGKANGKVSERQTRLEAYPELAVVRRPYDPEHEVEIWSLKRVKEYLAQGCWRRKVNKVGQITLYRRALTVGHSYRGRTVLVTLDPLTNDWVIQEANGNELARHQATEITTERICNLEVSNRPNSHQPTRNTTSRHGP